MSKLDDVLRLLDYKVGNTERLVRIRDIIEDNLILDVYDARYLQNLVNQYLVGEHLIESSYSVSTSMSPSNPSASKESDTDGNLNGDAKSSSSSSSKLVDDQALASDTLSSSSSSSSSSPPSPFLSMASGKRHKLLYVIPLFFCIFGSLLTVITHSSTTGLLYVGGSYLSSAVLGMLTISLALASLFLIQQKHIHDMKRQLQSLPSVNTSVIELVNEIQALRDTQNKIQKDLPNTTDIISLQNKNKELYDKFQIRDAELLETINQFVQNTAQDTEKLHKDTLQHTTNKIADYVATYLDEHSVSKEDFESLKHLVKEMSSKAKSIR